MTWYAWMIVAALAAGAILSVLSVGRPREPLTPGVVAAVVVTDGLMIWAIVALAAT